VLAEASGRTAPLETLDAFDGWPSTLLHGLEERMETHRVPGGAQIATETLTADALFLVRAGLLGLTAEEASGHRVMVALLATGDFFSTIGGAEAPCATALRDAQVSSLPAWLVQRMIGHRPEFGMRLLEQFGARAACYRRTIACVSHISVRDRLLARLRQLAEADGVVTPEGVRLQLELTHRQWAEFVGASREAVTLAFGELVRTGRLRAIGPRRWLVPWSELRRPGTAAPLEAPGAPAANGSPPRQGALSAFA
jgi:CRP/FNR family transcriptional regulator, cyclic AMP receptor protein